MSLTKVTKGVKVDDYLIHKDGSVDFTADQSMGGNKLIDVAPGISANDAVNVSQLNTKANIFHTIVSHDTTATGSELTSLTNNSDISNQNLHNHDLRYVNASGDSINGNLSMTGHTVHGLADANANDQAVNWSQVRYKTVTILPIPYLFFEQGNQPNGTIFDETHYFGVSGFPAKPPYAKGGIFRSYCEIYSRGYTTIILDTNNTAAHVELNILGPRNCDTNDTFGIESNSVRIIVEFQLVVSTDPIRNYANIYLVGWYS